MHDLAIRYGRGDWPGLRSWRLLEEELVPVCSPAYLTAASPIRSEADLLGHPLLQASLPVDWDAWLDETGLSIRSAKRLSVLQDYNIVIGAALRGQGVAIGRRRLIEDRLAAGELVEAHPRRVVGALAYHVVEPRAGSTPAARLFTDWLRTEAD